MLEADQNILQTSVVQEEGILTIEQLQDYGIGMCDILKLKQVGICTLKGLMMMTKKIYRKLKDLVT